MSPGGTPYQFIYIVYWKKCTDCWFTSELPVGYKRPLRKLVPRLPRPKYLECTLEIHNPKTKCILCTWERGLGDVWKFLSLCICMYFLSLAERKPYVGVSLWVKSCWAFAVIWLDSVIVAAVNKTSI